MAKPMTDKEMAKWEAKALTLANKWHEQGETLERICFGLTNRGYACEIKNDVLDIRTWIGNTMRTRQIGTLAR